MERDKLHRPPRPLPGSRPPWPGLPGYDWCGPPPPGTLGRATKTGERCVVCSTRLDRTDERPADPALGVVWRCPRCHTRYHEPAREE